MSIFLPADLDKKIELFSGLFYRDSSRIIAYYMKKETWNNLNPCLLVTMSENCQQSVQDLLPRDSPSVDSGWD